MSEVIITRGGQITLTKDIRKEIDVEEGDVIIVNTLGNMIIASKKDPKVFEKYGFLPDNFEKILKKIRSSPEERLKRFGIIG